MAYSRRTWKDGEVITAEKLNNMEQGIAEAKQEATGAGSGAALTADAAAKTANEAKAAAESAAEAAAAAQTTASGAASAAASALETAKGKAPADHTHNYAGSDSAGGAATSAKKVANSLNIKLNGTDAASFNGSTAKEVDITPSAIGASKSDHNHDDTYAKKSHTHTVASSVSTTGTDPVSGKAVADYVAQELAKITDAEGVEF